jgi:hypothetical protein
MAQLAPPPSTDQDINSRQFRDWFYSIYALIGKPGSTLGTMAYQNSNSVTITGGALGGIGISGSTINSTPIGQTSSAAGKFTALESTASLKTNTLTGYLYGNGSGGNVTASTTIPPSAISGGLSVTITTAKLTTLGSNGSMTFTNGILTSQTQAT